jgi:3-oxoacyl-[acyl-carrier protein] reductase
MTKALPEEQREALAKQIPLQCLGQPEDIAKSVTFLAGEGGAYITGQTLNVNGGMYMV